MGDFFADSHETNALEEMCDGKKLAGHRAVGEGFSGGFFARFESGDDRRQAILHERKLFVTRAHRVAFALNFLEPCDHRPKFYVLGASLFVCHQAILSQSALSSELWVLSSLNPFKMD